MTFVRSFSYSFEKKKTNNVNTYDEPRQTFWYYLRNFSNAKLSGRILFDRSFLGRIIYYWKKMFNNFYEINKII